MNTLHHGARKWKVTQKIYLRKENKDMETWMKKKKETKQKHISKQQSK